MTSGDALRLPRAEAEPCGALAIGSQVHASVAPLLAMNSSFAAAGATT